MLIREMSAVFGKLRGETLRLREGLNVVEAPNESGKSTWCALLLAMLYGIDTSARARGDFIPDKTRYAPWSGEAMSGRLLCERGEQAITLTRTTRRASAPMGEFSAVFTGTAEGVPDLTAANCGEALLGVSREVYERSAFIRQNSLAIGQSAELERRIAALITSGEEDTSYSDTEKALRGQLNRRRHNRTGRLPELESEIAETRRALDAIRDLREQLRDAEAEVRASSEEEARLRALLARHDAADLWDAAQKKRDAAQEAEDAETRAEQFYRLMRESATPPKENLDAARSQLSLLSQANERLAEANAARDAAVSAQTRTVPEAERELAEARQAKSDADAALDEAKRALAPKAPHTIIYMLGTILPIVAAVILYFVLQSPACLALSALGALFPALWLGARKTAARAQEEFLARLQSLAQQAEAAGTRLSEAEAALTEAEAQERAVKSAQDAASAAEAVSKEYERQLAALLPNAPDARYAEAYVQEHLERYAEAERLQKTAQEARMRWECIPDQDSGAIEPTERPAERREAIEAALAACLSRKSAAQSTKDYTAGRIHDIGEEAAYEAALAQQEAERERLQSEYDAIALALSALGEANAELQTRFSPELARRAADVFRRLTQGRYERVALDRAFRLSAEPTDDLVSRSVQYLSAGAADQLYLAARLAICDLVLPEENAAPIVLDDALTNFDPERCAQALRLLKEEAARRQIILFTCHSREAEFFAHDPEVAVVRLAERNA